MARYIFITGGVVSSLGKGLMAASLAALLQARGFRVRIRTEKPRAWRSAPSEAASRPLPSEETTPPVMKIYRAMGDEP